MKYLIFLLVFLSSLGIQGQDWAPILPGEKYHFASNGGELISNTLFVDSVDSEGQDETYYFNRIIALCDTCENNDFGIYENFCPDTNCFFYTDQAQFLQKKAVVHEDGIWIFSDPQTFELRPGAGIDSTWDFNQDYAATVTAIFQSSILGVEDSLKVILISNGTSVILSREHGILSFATGQSNFILTGLQEAELGNLVPDFFDVFNFNIGDVFEYRYEKVIEGGTAAEGTIRKMITETNATDSSVTVAYDFIRNEYWYGYGPNPPYASGTEIYTGTESLTYNLSDYIFLDHNINESNRLYPVEIEIIEYVGIETLPGTSTLTYSKAEGRNVITSGEVWSLDPEFIPSNYQNEAYFCVEDPEQTEVVFIAPNDWSARNLINGLSIENSEPFSVGACEGLGITDYIIGGDWSTASGWLTGYIIDGDTAGVITPVGVLLSNPEFVQNELFLFPNPTTDVSWLKAANPGRYRLLIIDYQGRIVLEEKINIGTDLIEIDLREEPSGIYLIQLSNEKNVWTGRIAKG